MVPQQIKLSFSSTRPFVTADEFNPNKLFGFILNTHPCQDVVLSRVQLKVAGNLSTPPLRSGYWPHSSRGLASH